MLLELETRSFKRDLVRRDRGAIPRLCTSEAPGNDDEDDDLSLGCATGDDGVAGSGAGFGLERFREIMIKLSSS